MSIKEATPEESKRVYTLRRPKGYVTPSQIIEAKKGAISRPSLFNLINNDPNFPKRLAWSQKPFLFDEKEVAKYFRGELS